MPNEFDKLEHENRELIYTLDVTEREGSIEQLQVRHPGADDEGLWFFTHPDGRGEVQVESSTGAAPFLVEDDEGPAATAHTPADAVALVAARLGLRAGTG